LIALTWDNVVSLILHLSNHSSPAFTIQNDLRRSPACFSRASAVITGQRDNLAAFLARGERTVRHWQAGLASTMVLFDSTCFTSINQPQDLQKT
jgi:molybdopterin-guanine dinucleotide biosynthesis protein A